ncbi:unnamed protein product [Musa textilis]
MGWSRGVLCLPPVVSWIVTAILLVSPAAHAGAGSDAAVKFLTVPSAFSSSSSATFQFEVTEGANGGSCRNCSVSCKLDNYSSSTCELKEVTYSGLLDGKHMFEVCVSGFRRVRCASYNWTVDTVSPTAHISVPSPFTNALNVSVNVTFSEPCTGGGGFRCSSSNCNVSMQKTSNLLFKAYISLSGSLNSNCCSFFPHVDENLLLLYSPVVLLYIILVSPIQHHVYLNYLCPNSYILGFELCDSTFISCFLLFLPVCLNMYILLSSLGLPYFFIFP